MQMKKKYISLEPSKIEDSTTGICLYSLRNMANALQILNIIYVPATAELWTRSCDHVNILGR